jgi:site-specific recombinase XerD
VKPNRSSVLGQALHGFFTDFLPQQQSLSPHTLCSYRDSLKLLLQFLASPKKDPSQLDIDAMTPERVLTFLQHLESKRQSLPSTRNVRLSAIHSFFRYVGSQYPQHLEQVQRILSLPFKRAESRQIQSLEPDEVQAILQAIDSATHGGRRDLVLLSLLFNTGARVSEVVDLKACDLHLTPPPSVLLHGKGRRQRTCPLWSETARLLREYLEEQGLHSDRPDILFRNHLGTPLTRFGVRAILKRHTQKAAQRLPSLKKKRVHPHCLRHSTALLLLRAGVDLSSIAHWLGHNSINTTTKYLTLDLEAKRQTLAKTKPLVGRKGSSGRWRKDENLITWLETL